MRKTREILGLTHEVGLTTCLAALTSDLLTKGNLSAVIDCNTMNPEVIHMRESVTIRLPAGLKKKLDQATKGGHVNRSDVVREALRQYFSLQDFRSTRAKAIAEAEARGIFTDGDVFREVS